MSPSKPQQVQDANTTDGDGSEFTFDAPSFNPTAPAPSAPRGKRKDIVAWVSNPMETASSGSLRGQRGDEPDAPPEALPAPRSIADAVPEPTTPASSLSNFRPCCSCFGRQNVNPGKAVPGITTALSSPNDWISLQEQSKRLMRKHLDVADYYNALANIAAWLQNLLAMAVLILVIIQPQFTCTNIVTIRGRTSERHCDFGTRSVRIASLAVAGVLCLLTFWLSLVRPGERSSRHYDAYDRFRMLLSKIRMSMPRADALLMPERPPDQIRLPILNVVTDPTPAERHQLSALVDEFDKINSTTERLHSWQLSGKCGECLPVWCLVLCG